MNRKLRMQLVMLAMTLPIIASLVWPWPLRKLLPTTAATMKPLE